MPLVTELFAFVAQEKPGEEGIMGIMVGGAWTPLIGADMDRIHSLKPVADKISASTGISYKLLHFKLTGEIKDLSKI